MEETVVNATKDDQGNEDSPLRLEKERGLFKNNSVEFTVSKSKGSVGGGKPKGTLTSDVKHSYIGERCIQKSFFESQQITDVKKLKRIHFENLNQKHLQQHYLDLVKLRPSDALAIASSTSSPCNIAVKLKSSKMEILFDSLKPVKSRRRNTCDLGGFVIDCPSAAGRGNLLSSPVGHLIVGAVAGNDNVSSMLKSQLICHLGALDGDKKSAKVKSPNLKREKCSQSICSLEDLMISSSPKLEKEALTVENLKKGQEKLHKRIFSFSSTNSSCSDQSSSSACAPVYQGMLHCKWKGGIPYFEFFVDDLREVYAANLWKVESSNDKGLDYIYSFHLKTDEQKVLGNSDTLMDLVGKMTVSSSFILCPNGSKLMETEFVLYGPSEMQSLTPTSKKNRRLSKKVLDAFRTSHPSKYKSRPKGVPSSIYEDLSGEQCQEMLGKLDALDSTFLECNLSPNLELAAIVVRDYVHDTCQEAAVLGGWGLKFLEKVRAEKANTLVDDFDSPGRCQESYLRNRNDCSTSMDVLIPAGFHGGPRTGNGGPSSLTARWRSGGHCDCGGWDIGCPLTVLHNVSSKEAVPQSDALQECKTFDLFMQGTKHEEPTLRMVKMQDGLYFVHFQSTLTALRAFSVGVSLIHNQSSSLCPKNVKKLKQQEPRMQVL